MDSDAGPRRAYTLRRRAAAQEATRKRIVEATVDLHRLVGPARTTITAVAARAGVQRHTVYRHFPKEAALFRACSGLFLANHPPPDPTAWEAVGDPARRLRKGLTELYAYYAANEQMIASVLRDSEVKPVGRGFRSLQAAAAKALAKGWTRNAGSGRTRRTALHLATDFRVWQALTAAGSLSAAQAARLMAQLLAFV